MFWMGVLIEELLMHLLMVQVQVDMSVHVIDSAQRQPVVLPPLVFGQLGYRPSLLQYRWRQ